MKQHAKAMAEINSGLAIAAAEVTAETEAQERSDADYLRSAIASCQANEIMSMVREMDQVVSVLCLEESFEKPSDVIRKLIEDRARFPDKPDLVGRMVGSQFGNLRAAKDSSDRYAASAILDAERLGEIIEASLPALEHHHAMLRGGQKKSDALALLQRARKAVE